MNDKIVEPGSASQGGARTSPIPLGPPPPRAAPTIPKATAATKAEAHKLGERKKQAKVDSFRARKILAQLDAVQPVKLPRPDVVIQEKIKNVGMV